MKTFDQVGHLFTDPFSKPQTGTTNELTLTHALSPGQSLHSTFPALFKGWIQTVLQGSVPTQSGQQRMQGLDNRGSGDFFHQINVLELIGP